MEPIQKIKGIYLKTQTATIGTGATQKTVHSRIFCEAREIDDDRVEVLYLRFDGRPSGIIDVFDKETFLKDFTYSSVKPGQDRDPKKRPLEKHIALADEHLRRKEYFAAEYEYDNALALDEKNVRATFGKGLSLMERGEEERARRVFADLAGIEAFFLEENKHLFNEFGIRLRKLGMYDEAIRHYQKAIAICPDDENLYFNMGRAYLEKKDIHQARRWIEKALETNPDFQEAKVLLEDTEKADLFTDQCPDAQKS
ncbi:MAG: tetratricopeptide repeat protein [Deltaproteobacteria bacterium]|nr:tetratricopeptide repeat protein [Deltaproteobacteria bacterium]